MPAPDDELTAAHLDARFAAELHAARRPIGVVFLFHEVTGVAVDVRVAPGMPFHWPAQSHALSPVEFARLYAQAQTIDRWALATSLARELGPPRVSARFGNPSSLGAGALRRNLDIAAAFFEAAPSELRFGDGSPASERGEPSVGFVSVGAVLARRTAPIVTDGGPVLFRRAGTIDAALGARETDDSTHRATVDEARREIVQLASALGVPLRG